MLNKNQEGLALLAPLLILIVMGLIAGTGYYIYKANNITKDSLNNTGNSEIAVPENKDELPKEEDPYEDWKEYSSQKLNISFNYPNNWTVQHSKQETCTGSVHVNINPSSSLIDSAKQSFLDGKLSRASIHIIQFGEQSERCAPDGNHTKNSGRLNRLVSTDKLSDGLFSGYWMTGYNATGETEQRELPHNIILTRSNHSAVNAPFNEAPVAKIDGATYQVDIYFVAKDYGQYSDDAYLYPEKITGTEIYSDMKRILESVELL